MAVMTGSAIAPIGGAGAVTTLSRVSVATDGTQANNGSYDVSVSDDGTVVAFTAAATNLVAGDSNGMADIFVRDRLGGRTARVNVASDGTQADALSGEPAISGDGRYVAFSSSATNLVTGDTTGTAMSSSTTASQGQRRG